MAAYPARTHEEVLRECVRLEGARVLDVGCGAGKLVRVMARSGARATGLEISERALARARAEAPVGGETYCVGRGEALPWGEDAFDALVFFNSLHHVPVAAQDRAIEEAARVLRPGGILFVVEPLCEGPMFELMRPVDDETEVRRAAYAALQRAAAGPRFTALREECYLTTYRYESYEDFKAEMARIDEARRAALEAHDGALRRAFEALGERGPDGYAFEHPNRVNVLQRR